jgi:uncharacterized protein
MKRPTIRMIWRWLAGLAIVYLAGGLVLYAIQDHLLFHPLPVRRDHPYKFDRPFKELNLQQGKANLSIVTFPVTRAKGVVLFFHGNRENVSRYAAYASLLAKEGYEVWMIDYPGFGKSTGRRSESILYAQAETMYALAAQQWAAGDIIIYGKSIGTGIAAYLASRKPCRRLILETPYYSVAALARHYFPIYPVLPVARYEFPVYRFLNKVQAPVTLLHGTRDEIIPYSQALKLSQ